MDDYINDAVDEAEKDLAAVRCCELCLLYHNLANPPCLGVLSPQSMPPSSAIAASRGGAKKIAAAASAASRSAALTQVRFLPLVVCDVG